MFFHSLKLHKVPHVLTLAFVFVALLSCDVMNGDYHKDYSYSLVSNDVIYDSLSHAAFTGIIIHKGKMYLAFREGRSHRPKTDGDYGIIKVLVNDGSGWSESATIRDETKDLRDPFLLEINGKLRVYIGYNTFENGHYQHSGSVYADYDGQNWSELKPLSHDVPHIVWFWKVRKYENTLYSVAYLEGERPALLSSSDGVSWKTITLFNLEGIMSEADMGFIGNTMYVCLRKDQPVGSVSWWGISKYPFESFSWREMNACVESPELATLPYSNSLVLAGRERVKDSEVMNVSLFTVSLDGNLNRINTVCSEEGGDRGYPGIAVIGNKMYCSYYTGNENQARIMMATFGINY